VCHHRQCNERADVGRHTTTHCSCSQCDRLRSRSRITRPSGPSQAPLSAGQATAYKRSWSTCSGSLSRSASSDSSSRRRARSDFGKRSRLGDLGGVVAAILLLAAAGWVKESVDGRMLRWRVRFAAASRPTTAMCTRCGFRTALFQGVTEQTTRVAASCN